MPWIAKNADDQIGRLISQARGRWASGSRRCSWCLPTTASPTARTSTARSTPAAPTTAGTTTRTAVCANTDYGRPPVTNPVLQPLNDTGNIAYSYQSTAIEAWLINQSWSKKMQAAAVMRTMPSVIATYVRWGDRYVLVSKGKMTAASTPGGVPGAGASSTRWRSTAPPTWSVCSGSHQLRLLRRPRRCTEGRAAHPDGDVRERHQEGEQAPSSVSSTCCRRCSAHGYQGRWRRWTARRTSCRCEQQAHLRTRDGRGAARAPRPFAHTGEPRRQVGRGAGSRRGRRLGPAAVRRRRGRRRRCRRCGRATRADFWMLSLMASAVSCTAAFSG